jgi:hypothetical protein
VQIADAAHGIGDLVHANRKETTVMTIDVSRA